MRALLAWLKETFQGLNRNLKLIFVSNLVGAFGDGLYAYLLPAYIQTFLQADPVDVGLLYTVLTLSAALTPLPGGFLAERYDWKKLMVLSWVLWLPVPLLISTATHWTMLFPAMVLYGCFIGGPSSTAYIAASAKKEKINATFTLISSAWWAGYIFSPSIGGYIAVKAGMKNVFYLAFIFYVLAAFILFFIASQQKSVEPSPKIRFSKSSEPCVNNKAVWLWMLLFALIMFFNILVRPFIAPFLKDVYNFDEFLIGVLGSFTFVGSAVLGVLIGKIGDEIGNKKAVFICLFFTAVSLTMFQLTSNFAFLTPIFFLMGTTYTPWALMNATISSLSPEGLRGRFVAISQTASMFAAFFAPYIGGVLYDVSPSYPFTVAAVGALILIVVFWLVLSSNKGKDYAEKTKNRKEREG